MINPHHALKHPNESTDHRDEGGAKSPLGRRGFLASLAMASLAAGAGVVRTARAGGGGGGLGDPDVVKQYLLDIKNLVCDVAHYLAENGLTEGPLEDPVHRDYVLLRTVGAAGYGQILLGEPGSLLFAQPSLWLFWAPQNMNGLNMGETADLTCQMACDALEEFCNGQNGAASEYLWLLQQAYCHLLMEAGID